MSNNSTVQTKNVIKANKLNVTKSSHTILKDISLGIGAGITGLIGPSGSGKTTLMRSIVGVQKYSGELIVLGKPAGDKSLRSQIGYVTQSPSVYSDLSVHQNLTYFAAIANARMDDIERVIKQVDLTAQANQIVESLSGGQRARVSLAIALLGQPDILILDEPTVGLDPLLRDQLWQLFKEIADSGKTIIVSSHVMDEADRCEDIILLRDGCVLWNDTRVSLLEKTYSHSTQDAFRKIVEKEGRL